MSPACRGSMVVIPPVWRWVRRTLCSNCRQPRRKTPKMGCCGRGGLCFEQMGSGMAPPRRCAVPGDGPHPPHIRRCKRYFAGIAARAGRWHNKTARRSARREVERATGIEPASEAWEASILPMNYARNSSSQRNRPVDHSLTADGRATGASRPTIRHAPSESFWPCTPQAGPPLTVECQVQRAHPPARRLPLPPSPCPRPSAPVRRYPARIH